MENATQAAANANHSHIISIPIPGFLQPFVAISEQIWQYTNHGYGYCWDMYAKFRNSEIWELPYSNVLIPVLGILLVFWPILLSLIMAIATAWAWIFWLITSILLGVLQVIYASYQFMMISFDICGLSLLKTYTTIRHHVLSIVDSKHDGVRRKSRRRLWRQKLDECNGSYENFLKIRIESKSDKLFPLRTKKNNNKNANHQEKNSGSSDAALPPLLKTMKRSRSFSGLTTTPTTDNTSSTPQQQEEGGSPNNKNNKEYNHTASDSDLFAGVGGDGTSGSTGGGGGGGGSSPTFKRNRSFASMLGSHEEAELLLDHDPVIVQELGRKTADLLVTTTVRLEEARLAATVAKNDHRKNKASSSKNDLLYLLSALVKRNHLKLDDLTVENARSIAESGMYGFSNQSRQLMRNYYREVVKGLDWVAESQINIINNMDDTVVDGSIVQRQIHHQQQRELGERITLVRKMKQNMGRTALMLSGGGAQAMYHAGVLRALIESKLYADIKVVSGTSGGSIIAAMCAIKTAEELYTDVCVSNVSTDYMSTGQMKAKNIRWFPPMIDMATYWMKNKLLVDSAYFGRTCEFYYKDYTFEEAFVRTGKHVCITVSASRASGATAQRLLLNHISTPHVTIASAVRASCALPGVMAPAKLMAKNSSGTLEPFEVDGVEWIDGSVQADLPFQRIATLFAVTSFVVSQTNFHVIPFLNKEHHPNMKSFYWRLFQAIEWDIRSRALKLSKLGLFPRIFGQDISKIFKQKYHGNLTIVPRFTAMQTFGLKALSNPTVKDMEGYLKYSQIATWPYLNAIRDMLRLEKALDDCLARLEARMRKLDPDDVDWYNQDDVESIASSSALASNSQRVRIVGPPPSVRDRDSDGLRQRMTGLERENQHLKEELERLKRQLGQQEGKHGTAADSEQQEEDNDRQEEKTASLSDGSEGAVWNLVRRNSVD